MKALFVKEYHRPSGQNHFSENKIFEKVKEVLERNTTAPQHLNPYPHHKSYPQGQLVFKEIFH